jgi:hypothetical protein
MQFPESTGFVELPMPHKLLKLRCSDDGNIRVLVGIKKFVFEEWCT